MNPFTSFVPKKSTFNNPSLPSSHHIKEESNKRKRNHDNQSNKQEKSLSDLTYILMDIDNHTLELNIDDKTIQSKINDKTHYDKKHSIFIDASDIKFENPLLYQKINIESNFDLTSLVSDYKQPDNIITLKKLMNFKLQQENYIYPLHKRKVDQYEIQDYITNNINTTKYWSTTINESTITSETTFEHTLQYVRLRLLYWQESIHSVLNTLYESNNHQSNNLNLDNYIYILGETINGNENQSKLYMPTSHYSAYIYQVLVNNDIDYRCIIIGINKTILTRLHQLGISIYELLNIDRDNNNHNTNKYGSTNNRNEKQNMSTVGLLKLSKQGRNIMLFGKYSISVFINVIIEYVFGILDNMTHMIQSQNIDVPIILSNFSFLHSSSTIYTNIPILCQFNFNQLTKYVNSSNHNNNGNNNRNNNNVNNHKKLILESLDYSNPTILPIHKISMSGFIYCKESIPTLIELLVKLSNDLYSNNNNNMIQSTNTNTMNKNKNIKLTTYSYLSNQLINHSNDIKPISIINSTTTLLNNYGSTNTNITTNIANTLLNPMQLLTTVSMQYNKDNKIDNKIEYTEQQKREPREEVTDHNNNINKGILASSSSQEDDIEEEKSIILDNNATTYTTNATTTFDIMIDNNISKHQFISHDNWIKDKILRKLPYFTIQFIISSNHHMLAQKKLFSYASRSNDLDIVDLSNVIINIKPYDVIEEIRWYDEYAYDTTTTTTSSNNSSTANNSKIEIVYRTLEPMQLQPIVITNQIDYTKNNNSNTTGVSDVARDIGLQKDGSILLQPLNAYSIYAND